MSTFEVLVGEYDLDGNGDHKTFDPLVDEIAAPGGGLIKGLAPSFVVGLSGTHDKQDCHYLHVNGGYDGFAAALAAAAAAGGGIVFLKNGTYELADGSAYVVGEGVSIIGENPEKTQLKFVTPSISTALLHVTGKYHRFQDFRMIHPDTPTSSIYGILCDDGTDIAIDNLRFGGETSIIDAGNMQAWIMLNFTEHVTISRCRNSFVSVGTKVPLLDALYTALVVVKDCDFFFTSDIMVNFSYAIRFVDSFDFVIRDCNLSLATNEQPIQGVGAIHIVTESNADQCHIVNNSIYTPGDGIVFVGTLNGTDWREASITDNYIKCYGVGVNTSRGIAFYDTSGLGNGIAQEVIIKGNKIRVSGVSTTPFTGMEFHDGCFDFIVANNTLELTGRALVNGIYAKNEGFVIEGNSVVWTSATSFNVNGIIVAVGSIGDGPAVVISDNKLTIFGEGASGISVTNCKQGAIADNIINMGVEQNTKGIFVDTLDFGTIEGNSIVALGAAPGTLAGILFNNSSYLAIGDNTIQISAVGADGIVDNISFPSIAIVMGNIVDNSGGGTKYNFTGGGIYYQTPAPDAYPLNN